MTNTPNWIRGICIGKGSFGTVNLAVDKPNGAVFAVKSVNQNSGRFSEALENEIRILKSLSSDYIVGYRGDDVTTENSAVYRNLHMEYMPGGTVADLDKRVDDVTVRSYTRCIVSALSYIHARNIIHCDVKGKNVLVESGVAKLADFGSAVESGGPVSGSGTRGSPLWMAPEVVRGEYQGPESDVWSLGCTVIEMVTGKPAWQDRGVDTLCQIGFSKELPKLPAHISDELRDFISKCLKRNRLERWSCDQLLQHPFLLSCSCFSSPSGFIDKKWSPRCVFDWSDSNFTDDNTSEIDVSNVNSNSSYARQRISILSSNSTANWESEGWELVRNVAITNPRPSDFEYAEDDFLVLEEQMAVTWPEYWESMGNNDGETTISRSERTNREYRDSNGSFLYDDQCTNYHAEGTSSSWNSRDMDNNYSCCVFVSLNKLLLFNPNPSDTFIIEFCLCLMLDQFLILFQFIFILITYQHFNSPMKT
ncbi:hypothetical protein L1987_04127 [Smallanthus sonchifolius]|uniref:Uncharacterized protein n=1 Tax=Smallanthus sonchifolius TaxID=185202 RepID=A0ACB9KCJ5_9ASTR|nr:hypothetical protein L1987_04127 [Smallanthus sonchifolius]